MFRHGHGVYAVPYCPDYHTPLDPGLNRPGFFSEDTPIATFREMLLGLVRDGTDLTSRQLVILLECREKPCTVRGLAETLNVPKPAITRSLNRVEELGLVARRDDPDDRRSILVGLTPKGSRFTRLLAE
jgi:DNA-binding MarR family transcriptional regulator